MIHPIYRSSIAYCNTSYQDAMTTESASPASGITTSMKERCDRRKKSAFVEWNGIHFASPCGCSKEWRVACAGFYTTLVSDPFDARSERACHHPERTRLRSEMGRADEWQVTPQVGSPWKRRDHVASRSLRSACVASQACFPVPGTPVPCAAALAPHPRSR